MGKNLLYPLHLISLSLWYFSPSPHCSSHSLFLILSCFAIHVSLINLLFPQIHLGFYFLIFCQKPPPGGLGFLHVHNQVNIYLPTPPKTNNNLNNVPQWGKKNVEVGGENTEIEILTHTHTHTKQIGYYYTLIVIISNHHKLDDEKYYLI